MDATTQIKHNLIARIKASTDLNFLQALQTIFDSSEQSIFELSKAQQESIKESRTELEKGEALDNDLVLREMQEWLTKK